MEKLQEGHSYRFLITSEVAFNESEQYFVLKDPFGNKHLLDQADYAKHNLYVGLEIVCRLDKINCSGKYFLEPEHPHYKRGEVYAFPFYRKEEYRNRFGFHEKYIVVKDLWGQEIKVPYSGNFEVSASSLKCNVVKIKRGKLILRLPDEDEKQTLIPGNVYDFTLVDSTTIENEEYWVLDDAGSHKHFLEKKYYSSHYRWEMGAKIACEVLRLSERGYYYLEPVHPYYRKNGMYEFHVIEIKDTRDQPGNPYFLVLLKDEYSDEVTLTVNKEELEMIRTAQKVLCKVVKMKKGIPMVKLDKVLP